MNETDKRYYKINIGGTDHIFTNVQKHYDYYTANEASQTGKAGKFVHRLSQAEIDRAVISDSMVFVEKPADFIFQISIVNATEYDNGNKKTSEIHLTLPQQANDIETALEEIGLPPDAKPGQYFINDCECVLKSLNPLVDMHTDIHELAETTVLLDKFSGFDMLKLNTIMETGAAFETLAQVKEFTHNRDYYSLEVDIQDSTQLGLDRIYKSGIFDMIPDYCKDAINPVDFGKYIAEAERGVFTSKGYLSLSGDKWQAADLPNFKPKPLVPGADERPIDATEHFAADLDSFYRDMSEEYAGLFDDEIQARYQIAALVQTGRTAELKEQICNMQKEYHLDNADVQPFLKRVENFERCKGNYLANAEMQVEQNYNKIDGIINNEPPKESEVQNMSEKMKVLVVEPMQEPYIKEIDAGLKSLQKEVGGNIQAVYPFEEEAAIICNEEGKINGLELNRALYDEDGKMYDILAGTFLVCGLTGDNFGSLPDDLINKFSEHFKQPETFIQVGRDILAIPTEPRKPSIKEQLQRTKQEQDKQPPKPPQKPEPER